MAHPFNAHRDHKVQHERVSDIAAACGGRMSVGGAAHSDAAEDKKLIHSMVKKRALRATGGAVKARSDRPSRAWGGGIGKKKKSGGKGKGHTVNVIVAPHPPALGGLPAGKPPIVPGVAAAPPPMPPPGGPPPMGAAPRPMVPPPPGPMGGPPGVPGMPPGVPPPMMPRKKGGRVKRDDGGQTGQATNQSQSKDDDDYPTGDRGMMATNKDTTNDRMMRVDNPDTTGDKMAAKRVGRATFKKRGGAVFSGTPEKAAFTTKGKPVEMDGAGTTSQTAGAGKGRTPIGRSFPSNKQDTPNIGRGSVITKATGGPVMSDSKAGTHMGPMFTGGGHSGLGRMEKMRRLKKSGYGGGNASVMNPTQNPKP